MIDWTVIAAELPQFAHGLRVCLVLLLVSVGSGFVLSVPLAVARVAGRRWLARPVGLYSDVFRGTPLLVQLFVIYCGLAQFEAVRESAAWSLLREACFCAGLAFALNTTAYTTEIFAGALRATPQGEVEAARAYGLQGLKLYGRVLLPGALRRALPQYGNEVVGMMHATAVTSTVTLVDVMRVARDLYANHLLPVEAFGTAAAIYFGLTFIFVGAFKLLERRFRRHLHPGRCNATAPAAAPAA